MRYESDSGGYTRLHSHDALRVVASGLDEALVADGNSSYVRKSGLVFPPYSVFFFNITLS